jgi:Ni,Fe-hydrogenase I small subunit
MPSRHANKASISKVLEIMEDRKKKKKKKKNGPYPWINSTSCGCNSSSLIFSIRLDIDSTE